MIVDRIVGDLGIGGIAIRHLNTTSLIVDEIVIKFDIIAVIKGNTAIPPIVVHLIVTDDGIVSALPFAISIVNVDAIPTVVIDVTALDKTVGRLDIEAVIKPA